MKRRNLVGGATVALAVLLGGTGLAQSPPPTEGPAGGPSAPSNPAAPAAALAVDTPPCRRSPLCGKRLGRTRQSLQRVQWKQTMGYTFTYPYVLPQGFGGVPAVALDSKGNLWVFQRADAGKPQCSSSPRITR